MILAGALPEKGVTLSQPLDEALAVKLWLPPVELIAIVCDGFVPPARAVNCTESGKKSSSPVAEGLVLFSTTGIRRVTPLPWTVRIAAPVYVPALKPWGLAVIVRPADPLGVEPEAGVTVSHEAEVAAVKERFTSPVLVTLTAFGSGAAVPAT